VNSFRKGRVPRKRKSSAPYVSGDSFLHLSDYAFLKNQETSVTYEKFEDVLVNCQKARVVIFVEASFLEDNKNVETVSSWVSRNKEILIENCTLLIHNGDKLPNEEVLKAFSESFFQTYAVNSLTKNIGIEPLPIGLENRYLKKHGVGKEFLLNDDCCFHVNSPEVTQSTTLASFSITTNESERRKLRGLIERYNVNFVEPNLKPNEYRQLVKNNQFVLSPPGNGFDCHRTWEAMYLGAIPVVLKDYLHPQLIEKFPILVTNKWEDFLKKTDNELKAIAYSFSGRKYPALALDHWNDLFRNSSKT
jgi:hypothetical protein